jgi:hypothetical protein
MPAATSDKVKKSGVFTVTTLAAPGKALGATSITVGSTTNFPTDTGIIIGIREVDADGELVAGTYREYSAIVASATTFTIVATPVLGSDRVFTAGSTTQVFLPLSSYADNEFKDAFLVSHDQDGTLKAGAVDNTAVIASGVVEQTNLKEKLTDYSFDFVASGCVWSGDSYGSTRAASMTAGVVYINGQRVAVSSVTARSFTASRDTYIDVGTDGVIDYTEVTNNAASPALSASHIRLGIIVTDATDIQDVGSINQGQETKLLPIASSVPYAVTDSLGNLICPRDAKRSLLGYKRVTANQGSITTITDITGLAVPFIADGLRKVKVTIFLELQTDTDNATNLLSLRESSTTLKEWRSSKNPTGVGIGHAIIFITTPSAGLHTYKASATTGGGNCTSVASATVPAEIFVEYM